MANAGALPPLPMIVHPAFTLLGFSVGDSAQPVLALAIYLALALVELIVDRRALMVSALIYLLYAMSTLLHATGAMTSSFALSALIAGAGLLLLSAYWGAARRLAVAALPERWKALLPRASA